MYFPFCSKYVRSIVSYWFLGSWNIWKFHSELTSKVENPLVEKFIITFRVVHSSSFIPFSSTSLFILKSFFSSLAKISSYAYLHFQTSARKNETIFLLIQSETIFKTWETLVYSAKIHLPNPTLMLQFSA